MPSHDVKVKTVFILLACLVLNACGALTQSDKPAVTTWWLVPYSGVASTAEPAMDSTLVSIHITAVPGLDSYRILALTKESELKPYAGARWADHVPALAESLLGRSLEASGRFKVASRGIVQSGKVCDLHLEVREFYSKLNGSGQTEQVIISFAGRYGCDSSEFLPIQLGSALSVQDGRMKSIVSGFQEAMNDVTKQLLAKL